MHVELLQEPVQRLEDDNEYFAFSGQTEPDGWDGPENYVKRDRGRVIKLVKGTRH